MRGVIKKVIAVLVLVAGVLILSLSIGTTENAGNKDFISYWAAGQLLLRRSNPYDTAAVFRLEKSAGFKEPKPLIMRNPPSALVLTLPLGLVGAKAGVVLWSLLMVASIVASVRMLWSMQGRPPDRLHLLAYVFAPTVMGMSLGQTSAFVLLGLVLFLRLHRSKPFGAGLCLALLAIKPHLFLVFGLVLLAWAVAHRAHSLLLGGLAGLAATLILPWCLRPSLWPEYFAVLSSAMLDSEFIPTVSSLVRRALPLGAAWTQFLPGALGCLWALWYFHRHAREWDWNRHGSLLLLLSVWVAPYSWFTDEIVVLPGILQGIYWSAGCGRSNTGFGVVNGMALLGVVFGISVGSGFYIWTTTAWLVWYVWAVRGKSDEVSAANSNLA